MKILIFILLLIFSINATDIILEPPEYFVPRDTEVISNKEFIVRGFSKLDSYHYILYYKINISNGKYEIVQIIQYKN